MPATVVLRADGSVAGTLPARSSAPTRSRRRSTRRSALADRSTRGEIDARRAVPGCRPGLAQTTGGQPRPGAGRVPAAGAPGRAGRDRRSQQSSRPGRRTPRRRGAGAVLRPAGRRAPAASRGRRPAGDGPRLDTAPPRRAGRVPGRRHRSRRPGTGRHGLPRGVGGDRHRHQPAVPAGHPGEDVHPALGLPCGPGAGVLARSRARWPSSTNPRLPS